MKYLRTTTSFPSPTKPGELVSTYLSVPFLTDSVAVAGLVQSFQTVLSDLDKTGFKFEMKIVDEGG